MLQRGHSGDGCVLASILCKYDLRKGDLFVQPIARTAVKSCTLGVFDEQLVRNLVNSEQTWWFWSCWVVRDISDCLPFLPAVASQIS